MKIGVYCMLGSFGVFLLQRRRAKVVFCGCTRYLEGINGGVVKIINKHSQIFKK